MILQHFLTALGCQSKPVLSERSFERKNQVGWCPVCSILTASWSATPCFAFTITSSPIHKLYQVQAQVTCEVFKIKTMWQDGSYLVTHITVLEYLGNFCNYRNWHAQWEQSCTNTPRNRSVPTNMKLLVDLSQNAVTGPKLDDGLSYGFWQLAFSFYANPDKGG